MILTEEIVIGILKVLESENFSGRVSRNIPLAPYTTYRIGGPAGLFIEPRNINELKSSVKAAREHKVPIFILGGGSNVLISDEGFDGVVIRLSGDFNRVDIHDNEITCGAAFPVPKLVAECSHKGFREIVRLAGIPGWAGGAVYMNAGTFGEYFGDIIERVDVLSPDYQLRTLANSECCFSYRNSRFQKSNEIILTCTFHCTADDPQNVLNEVKSRLERRKMTQPVDLFSCGCAFKNPGGEKTAAQLIEEAGLKGQRCGDAVVSPLHANFIVNDGNAKAADIIWLLALIRRRVRELYGITLVTEVQLVGFSGNAEVILDAAIQ